MEAAPNFASWDFISGLEAIINIGDNYIYLLASPCVCETHNLHHLLLFSTKTNSKATLKACDVFQRPKLDLHHSIKLWISITWCSQCFIWNEEGGRQRGWGWWRKKHRKMPLLWRLTMGILQTEFRDADAAKTNVCVWPRWRRWLSLDVIQF